MDIRDYLTPDLVDFFNADSRDEALQHLVDLVYAKGKISDKELFYNALVEREKIVSTGIGMGISIPHAKLPSFDQFFIVIGVLQKPVNWNALDGAPVRLIFMIGGPDDKQTEYLQILSSLTQAVKGEEHRKKLFSASTPNAVLELFNAL